MLILVINPGSTSTKMALYENSRQRFMKSISHNMELLSKYQCISEQFSFRKNFILKELEAIDVDISAIDIIIGRGGILKPVESGVYKVNQQMYDDLITCRYGEHASNLGGLIAFDMARQIPGASAYIADPVVVDELDDLARYSGHPRLPRKSIFHALNQKAVAREYAASCNCSYESLTLIVVHMGGGTTIGIHHKGRVIDVNNGLDGEGPFTPERSGTLPAGDLVRLCFSGEMEKEDILKMIKGKGGYVAYLGTNNAYEVNQKAASGDKQAWQVQEAMIYQVSKEIGAMATTVNGQVDAIILTGGVSNSEEIVEKIKRRVGFISDVYVYPGEDEMKALAMNVLMMKKGFIKAKTYH